MRANIARKETEIASSNSQSAQLQRELRQLTEQLQNIDRERRRAEEQLSETMPEVKLLKQQLTEAKRLLDDELLGKANMEDQFRRLEEEMKFKVQLVEQQLEEVRT